MDGSEGPALVTVHLWGVPTRAVPRAVLRVAGDRFALRRGRVDTGLRFAKLLGTGDGRTFTVRDADPQHWGLVAPCRSAAAADALEAGSVPRGWDRIAQERLRVRLRPIARRGT